MKSQREFPRLVISPKGTRWVEQGHPWIYEAEAVSGGENAEDAEYRRYYNTTKEA